MGILCLIIGAIIGHLISKQLHPKYAFEVIVYSLLPFAGTIILTIFVAVVSRNPYTAGANMVYVTIGGFGASVLMFVELLVKKYSAKKKAAAFESDNPEVGNTIKDIDIKQEDTLQKENLLVAASNEDRLFPWKDVEACMDNRISPLAGHKSCPKCGKASEDLTWIRFRSPDWTWHYLMGREGSLCICPDCHTQVDFICEVMN